jgi:uncharacterized damage-inducible protein DinB
MSRTRAEQFLDELNEEARITRRLLERVPSGQNDWKPHPRSMPFGYLAVLVATMPEWIAMILDTDSLDLAPVGGQNPRPRDLTTAEDLVRRFDEAAAKGRDALGRTSDAHLDTNWQLKVAGNVVAEASRYHNLRHTTINHWVHHRGQLSVYLRLLEQPIPSIYGPTADDQSFG